MRMDHLYLRNQTGTDSHFNHARGRDNDTEEVAERPRDYRRQKERLGNSRSLLIDERNERHEHRREDLDVSHWDMIEINFLKHIAPEFANIIERDYGLHAVRYSNFNQDVLFIVSAPRRFEQVFMKDMEDFCESEGNDIETRLKPLTTICDFHYVTSNRIKLNEGTRTLCEHSIVKLCTKVTIRMKHII